MPIRRKSKMPRRPEGAGPLLRDKLTQAGFRWCPPRRRDYGLRMKTTFFILLLIAMLVTLGVLAMGIVGMARGGEFNARYGNKLMRARVIAQGVALAILALAVLVGTQD